MIPYGALVQYKPAAGTPADSPNGKDALFLGWKLDPNFIWKGVYIVADYEALRKGKIQELETKSVAINPQQPWVFPMAQATKEALKAFGDIQFPYQLLPAEPEQHDSAPGDAQTSFDDMRRYPSANITVDRFVKYKATEGCPACEAGGPIAERYDHNRHCRRRYNRLVAEEKDVLLNKRIEKAASLDDKRSDKPAAVASRQSTSTELSALQAETAKLLRIKKALQAWPTHAPIIDLDNKVKKAIDEQHCGAPSPTAEKKTIDEQCYGAPSPPQQNTKGCRGCVGMIRWHSRKCSKNNKICKSFNEARQVKASIEDPIPEDPRNPVIMSDQTAGLIALLKNPAKEQVQHACMGRSAPLQGRVNSALTNAECACQNIVQDILEETGQFLDEMNQSALNSAMTQTFVKALAAYKVPRAPKSAIQESKRFLVEFACSPESELCNTAGKYGIPFLRLNKEFSDLSDPGIISQLLDWASDNPGIQLFGSLPCTVWSTWQRMSIAKYGDKYVRRLQRRRQKSMQMFDNFVALAEKVISLGGSVSFEWPRYCMGWGKDKVMNFISRFDLKEALFDGCSFGLEHNGESVLKPWRVVTSCPLLAHNLDKHRCSHPKEYKHCPVEGGLTAKTAYYTPAMCECIVGSLYPYMTTTHVPAMICKKISVDENICDQHREKDQPSLIDTSKPIGQYEGMIGFVMESDPSAAQFGAPGDDDVLVPAMVTQLLSRHEMLKDPDAVAAVRKEADGLLSKGTWDLSTVKELEALKAESKRTGEPVHLGSLMSICSIKFAEMAREHQLLKGRVVYRGDCARDEWGAAAVYQEMSASPTTIQATNANIAYGMLPGHKTTSADAVKAYVQSLLKSKQATWISLPPELWPPEWKGKFKKPMVLLVKSLYGHPESGAHWQNHLEKIIHEKMDGVPIADQPSSYWIDKSKLVLTVYVDDFMLSGPKDAHAAFWKELAKHVEIEDITGLERFLGRHHELHSIAPGSAEVSFVMSDYAKQAVDMYVKAAPHAKLKQASTPFAPEGSLLDSDDEARGELSEGACGILMKFLWLGRLARPDLVKPIGDLATHVQKWSVNDDKKLFRLVCYLNSTLNYKLKGVIGDDLSKLKLRLYADADFCGTKEDTKSTNGGFLVLYGPNTFFPLAWVSRKQTATSRSTTESEIISLAYSLFSEALPMLSFWEAVSGGRFELEIMEDNQATIKIVENGFSKKLRHCTRTHKVNIGSISEILKLDYVSIDYVRSESQAADIFTKALEPHKWLPALKLLGLDTG